MILPEDMKGRLVTDPNTVGNKHKTVGNVQALGANQIAAFSRKAHG